MCDAQRPLIILDRDGVINADSPDFIKSPEEFVPLPGSIEAIAELCAAGFDVVIASNQSGVGRGLFALETLEHIHAKMREAVAAAGGSIAGIFYCPHAPDEGCDCRKPRAGLFEQIASGFDTRLDGVPAVGDSLRDLQAAQSAGATPVLVRTGNGTKTERELGEDSGIAVYDDLGAAAAAIIDRHRSRTN